MHWPRAAWCGRRTRWDCAAACGPPDALAIASTAAMKPCRLLSHRRARLSLPPSGRSPHREPEQRDDAARFPVRGARAGGEQPEDHRQERAEPEHHADHQQHQDLRVRFQEGPDIAQCKRTGRADGLPGAPLRRRHREERGRSPARTPGRRRENTPTSRKTGGDLLSQALAGQVPSALRGLTALFGMGRGVSPSP